MKELPHFKTLKMDNAFELREYNPSVLAKIKVAGPFEAAFKRGSFLLADYCLGNNYKKLSLKVKSPFFLTSRPDGWEVSCFLPAEMSTNEVPRPIGDDVKFEELLARQVAVIKLHGKSHYPSLMRKTEELRSWARQSMLKVDPVSKIAIYQSAILPFMRRNEIHFNAY